MLFADLRGFTRWCEAREASLLVRELNRLLAVQADVVVCAGGDVDKFIGDAVMAVSLDREDIPERIFGCAQQLIEQTRDEIQLEAWPLSVGVGIFPSQQSFSDFKKAPSEIAPTRTPHPLPSLGALLKPLSDRTIAQAAPDTLLRSAGTPRRRRGSAPSSRHAVRTSRRRFRTR